MLLIDFIKCIMNVFKHEGFDVSLPTVYGYLRALEDSYFFHRVPRFDIRGKTALRSDEKFYFVMWDFVMR